MDQFKDKPLEYFEEMIREVDVNGDGQLDIDEFRALFKRL